MGLGSFPVVSLKAARTNAEKWRAEVLEGKDSIAERERLARVAGQNLNFLHEVALGAFESRKAELQEDGKAGRWFSSFEIHIPPKLGKTLVSQIDQIDFRNTLAPIWHEKAETARKAMNRLSIVMRHASESGLDVDLQPRDKAKALLAKQRNETTHIPSMPWQEVPKFNRSLGSGGTELALRFLILTGMRSDAARHLHEDQIDRDNGQSLRVTLKVPRAQ